MTKPITTFNKTLSRSNDLLDLFEEGTSLDVKEDIIRAAVIVAVAGFDRYFTSKFCDVLVPFLKSSHTLPDSMLEQLEDAGFTTSFALELVVSDRPFRKIRTIVQNSLSRHTTHRTDVIDDLFLALNLKSISTNAEKRAGRTNLIKKISKLVDIRNDIAHEAQNDSRGKPKTIGCSDIRTRISEMKTFVENCDHIIDNKFGIKPPLSG